MGSGFRFACFKGSFPTFADLSANRVFELKVYGSGV